ncbi:hypothetical protein N658DRAFT_136998 [Parathielavia hyrcaniae]|uniref:Uncharacterized protein n=1 Tax=Parathielavia hyrcaniae TaxID=113614 RepID=A0AAN6QET0_9PEZI|nr:hypothetical protein N658DRAFT_136998 [Parathielavia hyrcaniae]
MVSKKQRRQILSLAENTALLSLLRRAPTAAYVNEPSPSLLDDSGRILSSKTEVGAANAFAYLCGVSDDPNHVIALCVEELTDKRGIRVVVAINRERPASGDDILERIKHGLEQLLGHLSRVNKEDQPRLEDKVLDAVVDMCKQRIYSRIQSQRRDASYSKTGRAFLGSVLHQTLEAVRKHHGRRRSGSEVEDFIRSVASLWECLDALEKCQEKDVLARIKNVLSAAHRANRTTDFDQIFQGLSPSDLNPSTQNGFRLRLGKIAQYRECALYLLRTAKLGIFKGAEVKVLSLDLHLFTRELSAPPECSLAGCLARCEAGFSNAFGTKKITSRLMGLGKTNEDFLSTVRKSLGESRVHAEVQIVCYYELHPPASKPRIICSSKDACYLCNLFITLHGTFYVHKTHGNLYPGWRLLPIPALDRIQVRLNKALETRTREVVGELMTSNSPRLMLSLNENESTVFSFSTPLPKRATSVVRAEASGSRAMEALEAAQRGSFPAADVLSPKSCLETHPPVSMTGTRYQASVAPIGTPGSSPVSQKSKPATPSLPGRQSADHDCPHQAIREAHGELATGLVDSNAVPDQSTSTFPPEHAIPINTNGIPEQDVLLETALEPEKRPGRSKPGLDLEPGQASQSKLTPSPDHGLDPKMKTSRSLEPVPELDEPTQVPESESDPARARPRRQADDGLQVLPGSSPSFKPEPVAEVEQLPEPEPESELTPDQVHGPASGHEQDTKPWSTHSPTTPDPAPDPTPMPPETRTPDQLHLNRDQVLHLRLDGTARRIPAVTAGRITIHPEVIRSLRKGSRCPVVVEARIHWLPRKRAAAFYIARPRGFVELDMYADGVDIDGGSAECVYVAYSGEVVVIDFVRGLAKP